MDIKSAIETAGLKTKSDAPKPGSSAGGYFEPAGAGKERLKLEWVSRSKVEPLAQRFRADGLTTHQLRRFYNYCRKIDARLRRPEKDWDAERINVEKLWAFAADAAGKRDSKIPPSFREFIDRHVAMITTERDFRQGFLEHFQALVGYSALRPPEDRRGR